MNRYILTALATAALIADPSISSAQQLIISPISLDFGGKVITESPTRESRIVVTRSSSASTEIKSVTLLGPGADDFTITRHPSYDPLPHPSVSNTSLTLVYHPDEEGPSTATLQILTEQNTTYTVSLSGHGLLDRGTVHQGPFTGLGPGISTIGSGGDYQTLAQACADASSKFLTGGDWTFLITSNLTENQTSCLGVHHLNGYNITFRPAPGVTPNVHFLGAGQFLIGLPVNKEHIDARISKTSTNNITIDGSNVPGETTRSLTFSNEGSSQSRSIIQVLGDCDHITVKNVNLRFAPVYYDRYGLNNAIDFNSEYDFYTNARTDLVEGNFPDFGTVENCDILTSGSGASIAINYNLANQQWAYLPGSLVPGGRNFTVTSNTITSNASGVVGSTLLTASVTSNTIMIRPSYNWSMSSADAISLASCHDGNMPAQFNVHQNDIALRDGTSASWGTGISILGRATSGSLATVANNMISFRSFAQNGSTTAPAGFSAIAIKPDHEMTTASVVHNSIDMLASDLVTTALSMAAIRMIPADPGTLEARNNIIRMALNGAAAYCLNVGTGNFASASNNIHLTSGSVAAYYGGPQYNTLEQWKSATGNDATSISLDPFEPASAGAGTWAGDANGTTVSLHFTAFPGQDYLAPRIPTITSDIDGQIRQSPLTLPGADEIPPPVAAINDWSTY